jgi:hypothetical protein
MPDPTTAAAPDFQVPEGDEIEIGFYHKNGFVICLQFDCFHQVRR